MHELPELIPRVAVIPLARPVLFLDLDGVVNSVNSKLEIDENGDTLFVRACKQVDRKLLAELNRVLAGAGCDVVVSSAWRERFCAQEIADVFVARGMPDELAERFIDVTDEESVPYDMPDRSGKERGLQIQRWLDAHPERRTFAIVDDGEDMAHLLPYLVKTDCMDGLTKADADQLIAMLIV